MMGGPKKPSSLELSISIEIDSVLEARVAGMPVPVVGAGKRIHGHVVVKNANTQFTQGSIVHRVDLLRQRMRKDEEEQAWYAAVRERVERGRANDSRLDAGEEALIRSHTLIS